MTFNRRQLIYCITALAFLKIVYLILAKPAVGLFEDHIMAVNLMQTGELFFNWDGVNNHTYQFPVYPFLISLIYHLVGIVPWVACMFHVVLNTVTAFLLIPVFSFFLRQFRLPVYFENKVSAISFWSVLLFSLHPGIACYAMFKIHPFSLDLLMLVLPLYFTSRYFTRRCVANLILFCLSVSLSVLTRATLLVSAIPFFLLFLEQQGFLKTVRAGLVLTLVMTLVCGPWLFRNYRQDGITGFSSMGGMTIWKGSNPQSEGSNYLDNGNYCYTLLGPHATDTLITLSVKEQDLYYRSLYLKNVRANPMGQVRLYFVKLRNFWLFRSQFGGEYGPRMKQVIPFYQILYLILLGLSIFASIQIGKRSLLLLIIPLLLSLEQSIFYVETRHRLIIEPCLIFMGCIGFVYLVHAFKKTRQA